MTPDDDILAVLREIRDQQRTQLERQAEALAVQREQFDLYKRQYDRADRINERAEAIQARQGAMVDTGRRVFMVAIPLLVLLFGILFWPFLVQLWR
jgi:ABC-type uncharacterized transport system involved in gliding motility auxiliary subunit